MEETRSITGVFVTRFRDGASRKVIHYGRSKETLQGSKEAGNGCWRLVPHDNNIGQRNVHPVDAQLNNVSWEKLPFWIRNHGKRPVRLGVDIKLPPWLAKLGWKLDLPQITRQRASLPPDKPLKVALSITKGRPFDDKVLKRERDHDIVLTVLQDGIPVGGMTFRLTTPSKRRRIAAKAKSPRRRQDA